MPTPKSALRRFPPQSGRRKSIRGFLSAAPPPASTKRRVAFNTELFVQPIYDVRGKDIDEILNDPEFAKAVGTPLPATPVRVSHSSLLSTFRLSWTVERVLSHLGWYRRSPLRSSSPRLRHFRTLPLTSTLRRPARRPHRSAGPVESSSQEATHSRRLVVQVACKRSWPRPRRPASVNPRARPSCCLLSLRKK